VNRPPWPPGSSYTYGTDAVSRSPVSLQELELLQATLLAGAGRPRRPAPLPRPAGRLHRPDGQPDSGYLAAARRRFGRWILDTAAADYDQAWVKAFLLQVILWSHPYVRDGDF
jgi:hypothetical protein